VFKHIFTKFALQTKQLRLAAIDIGSNAARLLITDVIEGEDYSTSFNKLNLIRVPLRLGFDVFETGIISEEKTQMLIQTLKAFRHLINAYQVDAIKACATSAMRDAKNADKILSIVKKETGLEVEVISGELEANIVYENHIAENMDKDHSYMYIDVGGGSTEISVFGNGKLSFKKSFNIGTIRLLKGLVLDKEWESMKENIKLATRLHKDIIAIGSGGNINKVFSMSKKKDGKPLSIDLLRDYYKELSNVNLKDRIQLYNLREDRADVIVPALQVYVNAMRWANAEEIYVPKIGLADGLIHHLWEELGKKV
jgi:exopolyphosphatase/guanosine-5'-triphosphate,3'-diphosphate pyrophosphatase